MHVEQRVDIHRPVQQVWDFFTDFRNSPRWAQSGSEVVQTSDGPLGVGTTLESRKRVSGRFEIKSQSLVCTEFEPYHAIGYGGKIPLMRLDGPRLVFEPTSEGTHLTWTADGGLIRVLRPLEWLLARLIRWGWGIELGNMKRLAEGGRVTATS